MKAELDIKASKTSNWRFAAGCLAISLLAGLISIIVSDAWRAGFSGADEPAHFLNTYFIAQYARSALGSNPLAYAAEFYLHYPKISIGHWPPAYYGLLSPAFLLLPAGPHMAFAINLLISSLPAVLAGLWIARLQPRWAGLIGAFVAALTPVAFEGQAFFMLDQPVAAAAMAAVTLWLAYLEHPAAWKVIGFALLSATAVLIKGNGWLLLFVPPIHLALTGRWAVLRSPWPWVAGALAAAIVGPWYWLTAGIAADGFNYAPGLGYAWTALSYNLAALGQNVTIPALALAGWGAFAEWRRREANTDRWLLAAACLSLIFATLLLQSLVPVDLDPRYMAPAIPPLIVLALSGAASLRSEHRPFAIPAAALLLVAPGLIHLIEREPKAGFRLEEAAAQASRGSAWVIDGTSGAEGAFIAAMAVRDPGLTGYAVRASRLLSTSNFMGTEYKLSVSTPAEVLARLDQLGVEGIVVSRVAGEPAFPHSKLLGAALQSPSSRYRLVGTLPHLNRDGTTEIYHATGRARTNEAVIRALGIPAKAGALAP